MEERHRNDLNFLIEHHIETMAVCFSGDCLGYIRKLVSFKNVANESMSDKKIEIFVNVFIE